MPQFYTLLTDTGQAKLANAVALGGTIEITEMAVGDGGGSLPTPDSSATALINEVRRAAINTSQTDPDNPSWIVVEQVLPPDVGGWTIREIGIYDIDGDLIGIGNYPETYKPVLAEGSSRTQTVRFVLEVSDTAAVTLKVDPSVVLATREYVDQERAEHEASRSHPAATESLQGMIKRATEAKAIASSDNADAMTALRVFQQFSQYGLGREEVPVVNDVDTVQKTGFYGYSGNTNGAPSTLQGSLVMVNRSAQAATQFAMEYESGKIFVRHSSSGSWKQWRKLHDDVSLVPATQTEVNAGVNDEKYLTSKKLKNWVKQATESVMGLMKVATQAQTDAGTDDKTAVTPKKLRFGFVISAGTTGYVIFPSWLAGIIFQWGYSDGGAYSPTANKVFAVSYPIAYPNTAFSTVAIANGALAPGGGTSYTTEGITSTGFSFAFSSSSSHGAIPVKFISIGH